jgi:outer membrane protein assembly factor BamB
MYLKGKQTMRKHVLLLALLAFVFGLRGPSPLADEIDGRPLSDWVAQAMSDEGPEDVARTVAALSTALQSADNRVRVTAADALAVLGADAKAAIPALIGQLSHQQPWVRVAAMAALASMGKEAVPALLETFQRETGGPRIRAAFVLGDIGPDARMAVPVLVAAQQQEPAVIQDRFAGILSSIDPDRFAGNATVVRRPLEAAEAGPVVGLSLETASTTDWPQFHGPQRDALCREKGLLPSWPQGGPRLLWEMQGLGRAYSSVAIAGERLFTMGDRPAAGQDESQFVVACDLPSRKLLWATRVGPPHQDGGPRCTPTVDGNLLYALGTDGDLVCLETATGAVRWRASLTQDFGGKMMTIWKYCESPLVDGDRLICTPGGREASIVALNKRTGALIWQCSVPVLGSKGADGAAYSSAVAADLAGVRQYVQMLGRGVVGVEAETGRFLWGYNRIANPVANVTTPVVRGNYVFVTTAYSTGAALLRIARQGDQFEAREVYFLSPRDFQNHHGGVVLAGDLIFGGHGPNRGDPACLDFATGKVLWKQRSPSRGSAAVLYADGHLVFRYDRGEVVLIEASAEGLRLKGRFRPPQDDGPAWSHPVIHQGRLYLRHANLLLCYDLRDY